MTSILFSAFRDCTSFQYIIIPENVESFESNVFERCTSLESITIPTKVTSISQALFLECSNLSSIYFLGNVKSIQINTFRECTSLSLITLPKSLSYIGLGAFQNCSSLTSITIPSSVVSIKQKVFYSCQNLSFVYFSGTKSPSGGQRMFDLTKVDAVQVTNEYEDDNFCGYPVSFLPTSIFTKNGEFSLSSLFSSSVKFSISHSFSLSFCFSSSKSFIESSLFTSNNKFCESSLFTSSNKFNESSKFSASLSFDSNDIMISEQTTFISNFESKFDTLCSFTDDSHNTTETSIINSNKLTKIPSFSLTFIQMRSVSFSFSYSFSNSLYFSFDKNKATFILMTTQISYNFNFPYIIHYLSKSYVIIYVPIEITKKKTISKEQLIGIVCGSVSVFFLLIYIFITIYRKIKYDEVKSYDDFSSSSFYSQNQINNIEQN